ncbi:hypothetical protein O9X81_05145 [Agrobacterium salinitolerans]|uniref:hypothetical protein n=1 Tax=Agrobacterium salinitolerans TaxID=1183413 RepID=UPI0022B82FFC|nr:hypothetical protein [Agrobacterium salinitolerans]MCZ7855992.1 hypothetical protein [Agrobacterium salinitolerans]
MTTTEKKSEIVANGVDAQALLDRHLAKAYRAGVLYAQVIEEAVKNGFFVNPLEAKRMLAQARSLSGKIAEAAELAAELHLSGTQLAKDNDVDLGSVTSVGGVDFVRRDTGMITPFGGGR